MAHTKATKTGTQNTGTANTFSYSGSFDVFKASEVEVELDNTKLTFTTSTIDESASPREYTVDYTAKTIHIGGADLAGTNTVVIQPVTDMGAPTPRATYSPGASVTSADLNNNQLQLMRKAMEYDEQKLSSRGGTMTGNLQLGKNIDITFEGDNDNAHEITLTVADPTSDKTITLPDTTGTVITTGDDKTITKSMIGLDQIDGTRLADNACNSEHYTDGSVDAVHLAEAYYTETELNAGQLDNRYYTETEIDAGQLDNRYYTETELNAGQLDNRYFTETESDARYFRQDSTETIESGDTWSAGDTKVATTGAIDLRIIELVDNVGGFVPIANETSFPTTNPDINTSGSAKGGTIVSVQTASTNLAPSGTTVTIANGRGTGLPVVITGVSATIPSGYGFLVETTSTDHTYTFHRLVPKATEVATVAANAVNIAAAGANVADINNFADKYQISTSAPTQRADTSNLVLGDLWFDSSSNKVMMVYDASSGDGYSPITPNASDLVNIGIVSGQLIFQEDLGLITDAVSTGTGNQTLNTVAGIASNVTTVAGISSNVTTVAGISSNVTAVANDATDIGAVAGKATEIGRLGTADAVADMAILGTTDIVADMNTLATSANVTAMDNCSDDIANINTVAGSISNVNTAAGSISNINTVAGNNSNINTVAGNNSNISTVAGANSNISTVAGSISNVNTAASNITNINTFANRYRIDSSAPNTSLDEGDLYFDTSLNELRVYNGSAWQGGVTAIGNLLPLTGGQMSGNITFSGTQTVDGRDLSADGTKLDGIETAATADQTAAEIRTLVESASDSNVFTDADHTKLNGIEASATADQTAAEIRTLVESASDSNVFTDADHTKLNGIEASATADQTASEIVALISGQTIAPNVITTTNLTLDFGSIA